MLDKDFNTNELMAELKTKDGIASMNPTAYAFGLCYGQLTEKQKAIVATIVNGMENKKEDN
jgi:FixJ family two-component response regulator